MNFPPTGKTAHRAWNIRENDRNLESRTFAQKASYNFGQRKSGGQCIFERGVQRWNPALGNVFALGKILLAHLSVLFLLSGVHVCAVTDRNDPQPSQYYQRSGTTCNADDLSVGILSVSLF